MNKAKVIGILAAGVVIAAAICFVLSPLRPRQCEVLVLCGGSMRHALSMTIERYKSVSQDAIVATYGGSGELCAQIQKTGRGDIYVCHDPFMPWAAAQGLIAGWQTVGYLDLAIIVPKGNPKAISELKDLAQPGLRLGIGDQRYSTSGVIVKEMLGKLAYGEAIRRNVRMETKGHQQRCSDVIMGALDASIVWQAVAHLFEDKLETIPIPAKHVDAITTATYGKSDLRNTKVTIGIISRAKDKEAARRFYEFATTRCQDIFKEYGFRLKER